MSSVCVSLSIYEYIYIYIYISSEVSGQLRNENCPPAKIKSCPKRASETRGSQYLKRWESHWRKTLDGKSPLIAATYKKGIVNYLRAFGNEFPIFACKFLTAPDGRKKRKCRMPTDHSWAPLRDMHKSRHTRHAWRRRDTHKSNHGFLSPITDPIMFSTCICDLERKC